MKAHFITLLFFLGITAVHAQQSNSSRLSSNNIIRLAHKISSANLNTADFDKLTHWNDDLLDSIYQYVLKTPDFLQKDYPEWRNNGIEMVISADKTFRIVFWNTQTSGTLREYYASAFWQNEKNRIRGAILRNMGNASCFSITTFHRKDKSVFYLAIDMAHASNRNKTNYICAYQIENDRLNDTVKVFKTPGKHLNTISFDLDLTTVQSKKNLIHFSDDKKTLYIPVVNAKGTVSQDRYLRYKYDENEFVYTQ